MQVGISRQRKTPGPLPWRWIKLPGSLLAAVLVLFGCTPDSPNMLQPRGPAASHIATLWWILFAFGAAVFVVVSLLFFYAIFRKRRPTGASAPPDATRFVVIGGVVIPAIILLIAFAATMWTTIRIVDAEPDVLTIEAVGHQFWWEIDYPEQGIRIANEIHIPVGQPVNILVSPMDVIHSFWVPQLSGKIDMIPGKTNTITLQADEPGEYRGICAEFCGLSHAHMQFLVIAQLPNEFAAWVERQQQVPEPPTTDILVRGQQLFLGSACVYCHAVAGTTAASEFGPDLTHFGSRRTIAAGILENNRGNLLAWIVDPQTIKPGNKMPGIDMSSEDLQALATYLESLE